VLATSYQKPCGGPGPPPNPDIWQTTVGRGHDFGFTGTDLTGAIAIETVRNIGPCTSPTVTSWDMPAILPVNIQNSTIVNIDGDVGVIVQIGWMKCSSLSPCGNVPADGNLHFVYICNDMSGGTPCNAGSWAGTPVLGRRYKFRIQYNQSGTHQWDHSIMDTVTGVTKTTKTTAHWTAGTSDWWGAETHDNGSIMGAAHIANNDTNMYSMEYLRTTIGQTQIVTDIDRDVDLFENGPAVPWYSYNIYNKNFTNDGVNIWSSAH
jgi:hypothetical protein